MYFSTHTLIIYNTEEYREYTRCVINYTKRIKVFAKDKQLLKYLHLRTIYSSWKLYSYFSRWMGLEWEKSL